MPAHTYYRGRQKTYVHADGYSKYGVERFHVTVTVVSTAAGTAVSIIPDAQVGPDRTLYLQGFIAKVDGATAWTTLTSLKLQDTNGTAVDLATILAAALTGNARLVPGTANVTLEDAFCKGTGATQGKGLQALANVNAGAGSTLSLTVWGVIK